MINFGRWCDVKYTVRINQVIRATYEVVSDQDVDDVMDTILNGRLPDTPIQVVPIMDDFETLEIVDEDGTVLYKNQ